MKETTLVEAMISSCRRSRLFELAALLVGGVWFVVSVPLSNVLFFPGQFLYFISKRQWRLHNRRVSRFIIGSWIWITTKLYGTRYRITGDAVPDGESAIVMANHQQATDIPVLFTYAMMKGRLGDSKFFAKNQLKLVPFLGIAMLILEHLFLKRNWKEDAPRVVRMFSEIASSGLPVWMLLFPEGTRITPEKLLRSQEIAKEKNFAVPRHTLLPRPRGFLAAMDGLRNCVDAIYVVTIGYERGCSSLMDYIQGRMRTIHLHVKRYPVRELPLDSLALDQWLRDRYIEVDKRMEKFRTLDLFDKS